MCGIAGAIGPSGDAALTVVREMMARMPHRGPDSAGVRAAGSAAVGMCQLAIREASSRPVPLVMTGDATRSLFAYNGEVYAGHWGDAAGRRARVPATVDEEVLAITSDAEGAEPPDGMFALATIDEARASLTCWRDAFGIKPLYWREHAGATLFASEVRALAEVGERTSLRRASIAELLLYGRCLGDATFHREIHAAAPGARLAIEAGGVSLAMRQPSYWRAAPRDASALRAAIRESLTLTLVSERRVGLAISGGLDSTILAAELSAMGVEGLHTFSVKVEGADDGCDSLAALGLPGEAWKTWTHHVVPFGPSMLEAGLRRATRLAAEPTRMTSFPLYLALADAVSDAGIVVLLCGEGADELFGGYGSYRKWSGKSGSIGLADLAEYACPSDKERAVRELLGDGPVDDARRAFDAQFHDCATHAPFDALRRLEQTIRLEPLLHRTDLALMARSIEGRVPFLHGRVPELAYGLGLDECVSADQTKIALRRAYADVLPMARATAPKTNFRAPIASWFAGALAPWVKREMARHEAALVGGGLAPGALRAVVDRTVGGDRHAAALLFGLLSLGMFLGDDR